ncbi:wiskott-Aldrich syndrome protein homolog 1-like [Manacus vitellinus]|uniref:wiskott-Aldrich syndrome protein homolog 1-like n=1 Tax=Manacus vitellinus TaxID=328815 RepID=UPI00115CB40D|nr:wiskott-Aldrich syndrome protein homolog 1-like [Manacus vitellinus]
MVTHGLCSTDNSRDWHTPGQPEPPSRPPSTGACAGTGSALSGIHCVCPCEAQPKEKKTGEAEGSMPGSWHSPPRGARAASRRPRHRRGDARTGAPQHQPSGSAAAALPRAAPGGPGGPSAAPPAPGLPPCRALSAPERASHLGRCPPGGPAAAIPPARSAARNARRIPPALPRTRSCSRPLRRRRRRAVPQLRRLPRPQEAPREAPGPLAGHGRRQPALRPRSRPGRGAVRKRNWGFPPAPPRGGGVRGGGLPLPPPGSRTLPGGAFAPPPARWPCARRAPGRRRGDGPVPAPAAPGRLRTQREMGAPGGSCGAGAGAREGLAQVPLSPCMWSPPKDARLVRQGKSYSWC